MTTQAIWGFCSYHLSLWGAGPKPLSQKREGPAAFAPISPSPTSLLLTSHQHLRAHPPLLDIVLSSPPSSTPAKLHVLSEARCCGPNYLVISRPSAIRVLTLENQKLSLPPVLWWISFFPWYNKDARMKLMGKVKATGAARGVQRGESVHMFKISLCQCPHQPLKLEQRPQCTLHPPSQS